MKRRFGLFGFGFAIGIVLVFFFLGGKEASCSWMPNDRMLRVIRGKHIVYSPEINKGLETSKIDTIDINHFLIDGTIDFSKSQVKNNPCRKYIINAEIKEKKAEMIVKLCDSIATIESLKID